MAIDKKLIGQVKQACLNAKTAGLDIDLIKLAFRGGPILQRPILPRFRQQAAPQQAAPQQAYQAPAPQAPAPQAPAPDAYGQGPLPSEDTAASKAMWQPAPQGMQRFRNDQSGEVFYAPDQAAASSYVAGGNAGQLGIKPGQRVDAGYRQQMAASQQRATQPKLNLQSSQVSPPIPNMGRPAPLSLKSTQVSPPIPNMGQPAPLSLKSTQVSGPIPGGMGKGPVAAPKPAPAPTKMTSLISGNKARANAPTGMDKAIEEARRIRAQMEADKATLSSYSPMPEINTGMPFGNQ